MPKRISISSSPVKYCIVFVLFLSLLCTARAQLNPGPHEILPFEDGFIIEAFFDLQTGTGNGIADWSGTAAGSWVSPNAYDGHQGTDYAVQTGTPLFATAAGVVTQIESSFPENDHSSQFGNFVRIAVDDKSSTGQSLDVLYLHMLSVSVTNGQRVNIGDQVGLSDNTGNSTSEHVHMQSEIRGGAAACPFYWGHFKYPIMFNPAGSHQVGRIIRITATSTAIRTNRFDGSLQIGTAHRDQLYFSSYPKRGYYQVFIPNSSTFRSGWVRATDVEEVMTGTVIQALPDDVSYTHSGQLQSKYSIRNAASDGAQQIGQILFGGGRFVADVVTNGYYRIPLPGVAATWGWVKPTARMIVYPELMNPALDPASLPNQEFPITESFSTPGKCMFGRAKFNRAVVKSFSPSSPGGDGKSVFVTDATNAGNGLAESVLVGKPGHRNYFVQCHVYFNYLPAYVSPSQSRWERYGIFLRDDGFGGMDHTFEGGGNCYALLWDNDDGRLRAGRITDATVTDLLPATRTVTGSGWHTMRIESRTNTIKYFLDGELLLQTTDTNFHSGQCGFGYRWYPGSPSSYPAARGAYFDNFVADTLDPVPLRLSAATVQSNGTLRFKIHGDVGSTNVLERASSLNPGSWEIVTDIYNSNSIVEYVDTQTNATSRFYRAWRRP